MSPPSDVETEHRLTALETRLDVILPTLATKADIAELKATIAETKSSLLVWGITTAVAIVAIVVSLLFFLERELEAVPSNDSEAQPTVRTELGEVKLWTLRHKSEQALGSKVKGYSSLSFPMEASQ